MYYIMIQDILLKTHWSNDNNLQIRNLMADLASSANAKALLLAVGSVI